tara:strand:+ start:310 stop:564 length:255 start_codon:yes stop_codon:yes gene_type:complete
MVTQADYYRLQDELTLIGKSSGVDLADENIDHENVNADWKCGGETSPTAPTFWAEMCQAAFYAAGMRAEEAGLDINALMGSDIY